MSSANNRKSTYEPAIAAARTARMRLWQVWRWILAEAKHLPDPDKEALAARLQTIAVELNEGSGR